MKNRNLQIGSDFLQKSLYDSPSLQYGRQEWYPQEQIPLPFKVYQNTERYPLHQTPPLTLGDPRWAFYTWVDRGQPGWQADRGCRDRANLWHEVQGRREARPLQQRRSSPYGFEEISALLYYTYGFSRHDEGAGVAWPFHRFVASARCLFPTELYLWLPQTGHIPAGIYHYDNLHHSLVTVRAGEYRGLLAAAVDADLEDSLGVLLISAHFWKTAFKYINFAYRLCTQEAGIVASNALIVAGTLGYVGRVHYQFLDQPLNRLLGFTPDEESLMAVVPLYAGDQQGGGDADGGQSYPYDLRRLGAKTTERSLSEGITPIALDYAKTTTLDRKLCLLLTEMDRHTFLADTTEIVTAPDIVPSIACLTTEERITPLAPSLEWRDLAETLHFRSSGDMNFRPLCVPLKQEAFWEIVRYSLSAYYSDLQYPLDYPRLLLYIVLQHVEGIEAGIYRFCGDCGMLHVIERGDFSIQIQQAQMVPNVVSAPANLVCFLAGDFSAAGTLFGNRAYRIMNLEAGLIGHRISVMSAAQGLTARYSNSYIQPVSKFLLKLKETSIEPLAELVIGYEQPGVQAGDRYRFSLLR